MILSKYFNFKNYKRTDTTQISITIAGSQCIVTQATSSVIKCSTGSFCKNERFCKNELSNKWMTGIDMSCFREEYQLILSGTDEPEIQAKFDITIATESQKKEFVAQCIQSYKDTIENPNQLIWKTFQTYLINQLQIPKYRFKSLHRKPMFNEANRDLF